MRYVLSRRLHCDLDDIAEAVARQDLSRSVSLLRQIRQAIRYAAEHPLHYQLRPEIGKGVRLAVVGQYVVLFRIDSDLVKFERVVYGGRDLTKLSLQ